MRKLLKKRQVSLVMLGIVSTVALFGAGANLPQSPNEPLAHCLEAAYPDSIAQVVQANGQIDHILMKDGTRIPFDDSIQKTFDQQLHGPDFEDSLSMPYPLGRSSKPSVNQDPGRIRVESFLKSAFGHTAKAVKKNLVKVRFIKKSVWFNRQNGAHNALMGVAESLSKLDKQEQAYLFPIGGTYKWRHIAGTGRLSPHAFGIAIDINVKKSRYWRWTPHFESAVFKRNTPAAIVDAFEAHRFIWGGKWYHFDTMHFEYRPELFCPYNKN